VKHIADIIKPIHGKPNDPFPQIKHVNERSKAVPVTNAKIKQFDRIFIKTINSHSICVHYEEDFKHRK